MNKRLFHRNAFRTVLALVVCLCFTGCESEGPAEKAGKSLDKGIENVKDAVTPPGPAERAGRNLDKAIKP